MRPALCFPLVLFALALAADGQAQDPSREMMQSHRIERRMTGAATMTSAAIPAVPALKTTDSQAIPEGDATAQTTPSVTTLTPTLPATPSFSVPGLPQDIPATSVPSLGTPTATSNIDPNRDPFKPKMHVPSYEAAYKASLQRAAEEKRKRKSLMNAISDELTNYGLYILLGIVALLVLYALRKDPVRPAAAKTSPPSPGKKEEEKDIWKDNIAT